MKKVDITAYWGNDDAESSIRISRCCWQKILLGLGYTRSAWSWYEGKRYPVLWEFDDREISIYGRDGAQWLVNVPIEELYVNDSDENNKM